MCHCWAHYLLGYRDMSSVGKAGLGWVWASKQALIQSLSVFLPGESPGRGSLVGCRLWGHTELDTTEVT